MPNGIPRILLVEDDPISRSVLAAACQTLPALVDAADSVAAATALGCAHAYDAWLIDANLPDGSGIGLLQRLRERHAGTPALAQTAANDRETLDALIAAGFHEVLIKPLPASAVQAALRRVLAADVVSRSAPAEALPIGAKLPIWDDDAAKLALNGNCGHIDALRGLFVSELALVQERVTQATRDGDLDALRGELHRLRASCGFVGAARLGQIVQESQLSTGPSWLLRFEATVQDTLQQWSARTSNRH